ncbi:MAG TPA: hypothetical protein VFK35_08705 [Candidatus Limnocylindrales bacterium]|nr:hypothetical protein [Candidatus Limnocylindrales bacterium]
MDTQSAPSRTRARSLQAKVQRLGRRLAPDGRSSASVPQPLARTTRRAWFLLDVGRPALNLGRTSLSTARDRV